MTGRWFTRTAVAARLGISRDEVEDLIAADVLHLENIAGDHEVISERSVEDYERTRSRPEVGRWNRATDPEYWREQADYTPNDEGDEH
ncbi:hypothetical protein [Nonomuraea sp. NPDC001023]|uniref:hypothetical protein n=1 Tax=unclassified Nonomuraea TaxID=2593643 RepID=UPI00333109D5